MQADAVRRAQTMVREFLTPNPLSGFPAGEGERRV
jgi:hypothetical protein